MNNEMKKEKKQKKKKQGKQITIFAMVLGIIIILTTGGLLVWQSGVIENHAPAITINGENYRLSELNYYYYAYYNAYLNDYKDYAEYMFDKNQSLKTQAYDKNQSWFEFFTDGAVESMTSVIDVAKQALEAGYSLDREAKQQIETTWKSIESAARQQKITTSDYLENVYGAGMNEQMYRKHAEYSYLATAYGDKVKAELPIKEKEVCDYYKKHEVEYTFVNYERFYVKGSDENAKQLAEIILKEVQCNGELKKISEAYKEKGTYYSSTDAYYDKSFSYGDWLFSKERKEEDSTIVKDAKGYYVMVFHSRDIGEYKSANIIDSYFPVDVSTLDTESEDYSNQIDQLFEESCNQAEKTLSGWQQDKQVTSKSADMVKQVTKGDLDTEIEQWIFESGRKTGDCAVLYTKEGFHAVYYVDSGPLAWKVKVESDVRDEKYEEWYQDILKHAKVKEHHYVIGHAGGNQ
ncbi:MAG: hypothetical protein RR621_09985 [Lachnospiraceae bacterium]